MHLVHTHFADVYNSRSLATKLRRKRVLFFKGLLRQVQRPLRILDVVLRAELIGGAGLK
jgi:hypothetical protein